MPKRKEVKPVKKIKPAFGWGENICGELDLNLTGSSPVNEFSIRVVLLPLAEYRRLRRESKLYYELLMEVARKFPGESRHETTLRYIRRSELNDALGELKEAVGRAGK